MVCGVRRGEKIAEGGRGCEVGRRRGAGRSRSIERAKTGGGKAGLLINLRSYFHGDF
jgi:hypothetical protein